jgi:hypothetical protein
MVLIAKKPKTKRIDLGANQIRKQLKILDGRPHVKVGFPAENKPTEEPHVGSKGLRNVDIAVYHEFGTEKIPQRSFIRTARKDNLKKWIKATLNLQRKIYQGRMTVSKALDILGLKLQKDIKRKITQGDPSWDDLADSTKISRLKKGSGDKGPIRPLVDTGQMRNAVTYIKVMKGGFL